MSHERKDESLAVSGLPPASSVPAGTVINYAGQASTLGNLKAAGWLTCDGSTVSAKNYPRLFAAIGTTYGGNGAPMFSLPDLRGMFLRGVDGGSGNDPDTATRTSQADGAVVGDVAGSRQPDQLANHTHQVNYFEYITRDGNDLDVLVGSDSPNITGKRNLQDSSTDGGGAESRPKNVYVYFLIAAGH